MKAREKWDLMMLNSETFVCQTLKNNEIFLKRYKLFLLSFKTLKMKIIL